MNLIPVQPGWSAVVKFSTEQTLKTERVPIVAWSDITGARGEPYVVSRHDSYDFPTLVRLKDWRPPKPYASGLTAILVEKIEFDAKHPGRESILLGEREGIYTVGKEGDLLG